MVKFYPTLPHKKIFAREGYGQYTWLPLHVVCIIFINANMWYFPLLWKGE